MISIFDRLFSGRPLWFIILSTVVLVGFMGMVDRIVGYEMSFSIFYLVPIVFAAWYSGRPLGILCCVISAMLWHHNDIASGHLYSQAWIPLWNAGVRFSFFFITTYLVTELRLRMEEVAKLAVTDGLTGLKNSFAFKHDAEPLFNLAARHKHPIVIGYIDLDNFKTVNDTMGHTEGDNVLRTVGKTLNSFIRATDMAGRLGGDEFALLLPHTDKTGAAIFFEKLRTRLLAEMKERSWPVGFSIGVAVFPGAAWSAQEALKRADALMYRIKKSGKNNILMEEYDVITQSEERTNND